MRLECLRPGQWEAAAREFPVVYVPFGLIEWHGRHLPVGTDSLKAHGILVDCARRHGGLVYPPLYFPSVSWNAGRIREEERNRVDLVEHLFQRLKLAGFRVIIGVSGHNIDEQVLMIRDALASVMADGTVTGTGIWEFSLAESPEEANSDHAAKWETSDMMHLHPELVAIDAIGTAPLATGVRNRDGIGGEDPRTSASQEIGRRKCELCADSIARKARQLLASLPPEHRSFGLPELSPEFWWEI